ncbi:MAG: hypothetical protein ACJAQT_003238 [Akkermansiaceae bacterium]|jgi:hypothetical protein
MSLPRLLSVDFVIRNPYTLPNDFRSPQMSQNETIEFACPNCNQGLRVPAQLTGITGPCPYCQASITAPHPAPAAFQEQPAPQQQAYYQPQAQQPAPQYAQQPTQQAQPGGRPPGSVPHNQPVNSQAQLQQRAAPVEMTPAQRPQPHKRKVWPTILFPALLLLLAAAVVYLILDLMGILNFGEKKGTPEIPNPVTDAIPKAPNQDTPILIEPVEGPSPILVDPEIPPLEHDPQDIKKDGEVSTELPDLASSEARNESVQKKTAAINEARQILKRFLVARTYKERMPLITQSERPPEELAASCLGKPFPKSSEPGLIIGRERETDRSFEVFFSVAFDDGKSDRSRIVLVKTITYSEEEAPKIHTDPFIDLYEESVGSFYEQKTEGTATFHSLVEYSAYTYDDIPKAIKMAKVTFYTNLARISAPIATAYLSKESKAFKQLKKLAQARDRIPATVSVAWDIETDPERPFLQVIRVEAINWTL